MLRSLIARLRGGGSTRRDEVSDDGGDADAEADPDADPDDAEDHRDVWDLIPSWEYNGKYVQSGGHSRGEQERALRDIQRQAAEIEGEEELEELQNAGSE